MADPTAAGGGTEGLREALCALMWAQQHPHERLIWAEVVKIAAQHPRNMGAMRVGAMRHCADALIAGPLADFLARASAEQARIEAERDEALKLCPCDGLEGHEPGSGCPYYDREQAAEANLNALAKMYGEACRDLVRLHMALDFDDVAWGMYTARRDRERITALTAERDEARASVDQVRAAMIAKHRQKCSELQDSQQARNDAESRVASLTAERDRLKAALDEAEACLSIVEPRTDRAEYLRTLKTVRAALKFPEVPDA